MKSLLSIQQAYVSPLTGGVLAAVCLALLFNLEIPFIDPISLILVVGGTLIAGVVGFEPASIPKAIKDAIAAKPVHPLLLNERVAFFTEASQIVRSKGNIALEKLAGMERDPLLRKGLQLVADACPSEEIRYSLNLDIRIFREQRRASVDILTFLASVAPAAGLIGTVIGLILMLSDIENSADLGSGMSLALLTTLYGAMLSYLLLQPLATRLEKSLRDIDMLHSLTLEGIMALSKGISPSLVQEHLEAFSA